MQSESITDLSAVYWFSNIVLEKNYKALYVFQSWTYAILSVQCRFLLWTHCDDTLVFIYL